LAKSERAAKAARTSNHMWINEIELPEGLSYSYVMISSHASRLTQMLPIILCRFELTSVIMWRGFFAAIGLLATTSAVAALPN
jgi:hypothetical protein